MTTSSSAGIRPTRPGGSSWSCGTPTPSSPHMRACRAGRPCTPRVRSPIDRCSTVGSSRVSPGWPSASRTDSGPSTRSPPRRRSRGSSTSSRPGTSAEVGVASLDRTRPPTGMRHSRPSTPPSWGSAAWLRRCSRFSPSRSTRTSSRRIPQGPGNGQTACTSRTCPRPTSPPGAIRVSRRRWRRRGARRSSRGPCGPGRGSGRASPLRACGSPCRGASSPSSMPSSTSLPMRSTSSRSSSSVATRTSSTGVSSRSSRRSDVGSVPRSRQSWRRRRPGRS